jgi:hypothetical protein
MTPEEINEEKERLYKMFIVQKQMQQGNYRGLLLGDYSMDENIKENTIEKEVEVLDKKHSKPNKTLHLSRLSVLAKIKKKEIRKESERLHKMFIVQKQMQQGNYRGLLFGDYNMDENIKENTIEKKVERLDSKQAKTNQILHLLRLSELIKMKKEELKLKDEKK